MLWIRIETYEVMKLKTGAVLGGPDVETTAIAEQKILSHLLKGYDKPVAVQLWNGESVGIMPDSPYQISWSKYLLDLWARQR